LKRSADFQVCRIAGFQTGGSHDIERPADLEIGDTAGLETCATKDQRHLAVKNLRHWAAISSEKRPKTPGNH
jgi:hypothetical protein